MKHTTSTYHPRNDDTKDETTMPTQTVDKTADVDKSTAPPKTAPSGKSGKTNEEGLSKLRKTRVLPLSGRTGNGIPVVVWGAFFRVVVLIADYLLAAVTSMTFIPMLAAYLHDQSGASKGNLSTDGTIAMWVVPLAFLVILIAAAEFVIMRGMWHWATRMIQKIRDGRGEELATETVPASARVRISNQPRKTNRKRGK